MLFYGTKWKLADFLDRAYPFILQNEPSEFDVGWEETSSQDQPGIDLFWVARMGRRRVTLETCPILGAVGADSSTSEGFGWINYVLRGRLSDGDADADVVVTGMEDGVEDHTDGGMDETHYDRMAAAAAAANSNIPGYVYDDPGSSDGPDVLGLELPGLRSVQVYQLMTHWLKAFFQFNYSTVCLILSIKPDNALLCCCYYCYYCYYFHYCYYHHDHKVINIIIIVTISIVIVIIIIVIIIMIIIITMIVIVDYYY